MLPQSTSVLPASWTAGSVGVLPRASCCSFSLLCTQALPFVWMTPSLPRTDLLSPQNSLCNRVTTGCQGHLPQWTSWALKRGPSTAPTAVLQAFASASRRDRKYPTQIRNLGAVPAPSSHQALSVLPPTRLAPLCFCFAYFYCYSLPWWFWYVLF